MKLKNCETTWICQLSKPQNYSRLVEFKETKDKSGKSLSDYYRFIIGSLRGTKAWNISGVNKMVNELTEAARATLNHAKKGKTSSYAHAAKLLNTIERFGDKTAFNKYNGNYSLDETLSEDELTDLETL